MAAILSHKRANYEFSKKKYQTFLSWSRATSLKQEESLVISFHGLSCHSYCNYTLIQKDESGRLFTSYDELNLIRSIILVRSKFFPSDFFPVLTLLWHGKVSDVFSTLLKRKP